LPQPPVFADLGLARRLERTEAIANARFVEARAALFPESGAGWIEVAGAYAMFDGVASPCTQTFGLGVFQPATAPDLDAIETFYRERAAPVFHEVSPLADPSVLSLLTTRTYQPFELTSVMFRPIGAVLDLAEPRNPRIRTRPIGDGEQDAWAMTAAKGWADSAPADVLQDLMRISAKRQGAFPFLAELDGAAVAAGALTLHDGVAFLAGASTIPEARKQGAQLALLNARLSYAAEHGCDLAMMCAQPGSASQRNAERHGFRIAYTRIKWHLGA
jgi:GNAT superfamily N-acetyltransferase